MAKAKKSKKKLFIFGGLALLILVVVVLVVTGGNKENIVSVQTEKAVKKTITQVVNATGKINPVYQVILRPEVNGEIVELPIKEGDQVKKGQLLLRIKPDIYEAQRESAKARLSAAQALLQRTEAALGKAKYDFSVIEDLYKKELASEQEFKNAQTNLKQVEADFENQKASVRQVEQALKEANENLAKTAVHSPIDGTITELPVELSERVLGSSFSQGTHLLTVADLSAMEATVEVDENDVVLISVGDTANVEIDAFRDKKFLGVVSQIGNSAISTGLGTQDEVVNFEVKVLLLNPNNEIRPGMSCDADIETETRFNVVAVPIQSVTARMSTPKMDEGETGNDSEMSVKVEKNGKPSKPEEVVFVAENGKAKKVPVKIGISDDKYIEITEGLDEGAEIISGPYRAISRELEDGTTVMVQGGQKDKNEGPNK
jgi:HlyD family secretion protein